MCIMSQIYYIIKGEKMKIINAKEIKNNKPKGEVIICDCIDEQANIWDFTYYSNWVDNEPSDCEYIENIDMDNIDIDRFIAEWNSPECDWKFIPYNKKLIREISQIIMDFFNL